MRFYTELTCTTLYSDPEVSTFTNPEQQVYLEKLLRAYLERGGAFLNGQRNNTELGNAEGLDVETRKKQGLGSLWQSSVLEKLRERERGLRRGMFTKSSEY